ncbi:hypothetical protein ACFL0H_06765 [Thermodesulfobacteriota bacterium]
MSIGDVDSTEMDTEFDIIDEITETVEDIENALSAHTIDKVSENISYLKFLIGELNNTLTGEFEALRKKRFIVKKTV